MATRTPKPSEKRLAIDKDKTVMFVVVAIAAVMSVGAVVIGKGLWGRASYMSRVAAKKEAAVKQLKTNEQSVSSLKTAYETFVRSEPNLLGGTREGTEERDGDNATIVLDALPSKYDFPALTSSLDKLLSAYTINNISGEDDIIEQQDQDAKEPVEIPFSISVTTDYNGMKDLISSFNRSIRPFQITKLSLSGSNQQLQTEVEARTFYQPELGLQIKEEKLQ